MKKKSDSRIIRVFTSIINIPYWFDWDRVKLFTGFVGSLFQHFFIPDIERRKKNEAVLTESFETAQKALKLSDKDLLVREKALYRLSILMLLLAFCIFIYTGYHLFWGTFRAALVSFVVMLIALALAFRYHFWYYQIKNRKLGCSFEEWFKKGLLRAKDE